MKTENLLLLGVGAFVLWLLAKKTTTVTTATPPTPVVVTTPTTPPAGDTSGIQATLNAILASLRAASSTGNTTPTTPAA